MNHMMLGVRVHITPDLQKRRLSENVPVTAEFRNYINQWMREFFGTSNLLPDGVVTVVAGQFHMNPRTHEALKAQLEKQQ